MKPINNSTRYWDRDLRKCEQDFIKWACGNTGGSGNNAGRSAKRLTSEQRLVNRAKLETRMLKHMRELDVIGAQESLGAAAVRMGLAHAPPKVEEEEAEIVTDIDTFDWVNGLLTTGEDPGQEQAGSDKDGYFELDEEFDAAAPCLQPTIATGQASSDQDGCFALDKNLGMADPFFLQEDLASGQNEKEESGGFGDGLKLHDDSPPAVIAACAGDLEISAFTNLPIFSDVSAVHLEQRHIPLSGAALGKRKRQDDDYFYGGKDEELTQPHIFVDQSQQAKHTVKPSTTPISLPPTASYQPPRRPTPEEIKRRRARSHAVKETAARQQMKDGVVDPALIVVDNSFDYSPPKRQKRAHFGDEVPDQEILPLDRVQASGRIYAKNQYDESEKIMHLNKQVIHRNLDTIRSHTRDPKRVRYSGASQVEGRAHP